MRSQLISSPSRIVLLEGIHPIAKEILSREGFSVRTESHSPSETEMVELLREADAVGIRSKTQVTRSLIEKSRHVSVIGVFCIGTDQVSLPAAN
jgi:D-3-phosphoglycerate dehydrogenase / 2-oxoglutarate reductase